jgi:hypothetical protein
MAKSLGRQTGRTCCQGEASNIERDPHTHTHRCNPKWDFHFLFRLDGKSRTGWISSYSAIFLLLYSYSCKMP